MLPRSLRCSNLSYNGVNTKRRLLLSYCFLVGKLKCSHRETPVSLRKHCHKRCCSVAILMVGTAQQYKTHSKTVAFERLLLWVLLFWHCYLGSMPDVLVCQRVCFMVRLFCQCEDKFQSLWGVGSNFYRTIMVYDRIFHDG